MKGLSFGFYVGLLAPHPRKGLSPLHPIARPPARAAREKA